MRNFKLKNCKRIHGVVFSPNGGQLLVLGGYEAVGPGTAFHIDLTSGEPTKILSFLANSVAGSRQRTRLAFPEDAYSPAPHPRGVCWRHPWVKNHWWHAV